MTISHGSCRRMRIPLSASAAFARNGSLSASINFRISEYEVSRSKYGHQIFSNSSAVQSTEYSHSSSFRICRHCPAWIIRQLPSTCIVHLKHWPLSAILARSKSSTIETVTKPHLSTCKDHLLCCITIQTNGQTVNVFPITGPVSACILVLQKNCASVFWYFGLTKHRNACILTISQTIKR